MAVDIFEAKDRLNIDPTDVSADAELDLYVDAANEWVAAKVGDSEAAPVKLATLILIDHLWWSQRGPTVTPLDDATTVSVGGRAYAIPNRARELLAPYMTSMSPTYDFPDAGEWPDPVST